MKCLIAILVGLTLIGVFPIETVALPLSTTSQPTDKPSTTTSGPIRLTEGAVTGIDTSDGGVLIDTTRGGTTGVPVNARYEYGDPVNPTQNPAFTLTNTADSTRAVTLTYTGPQADNPEDNVGFRFYDSGGNHVATMSEETGTVSVAIEPRTTLYAVVVVDTHGLTPDADLSGTFTVRT